MKTRLIIAIMAFCMIAGQFTISAQNHGQQGMPDPEQMVQFAADRMAKELALDDATTAQFVEVYKAYLTDKFALMRELRGMRGQNPQGQNAENGGHRGRRNEVQNEESAAEQIVRSIECRQKMIELEQKQLALYIQHC